MPERRISFFPVRTSVMALAVSNDADAAFHLQESKVVPHAEIPADPVWSLIPVAELKKNGSLPPVARAFLVALDGAQSVVLAAGPEGKSVVVRLDAACAGPAQAAALTNQLRDITAHLRDAAGTPDPKDLGGVLAAGAFEQKEAHVLGRWPVEHEFLESLAGGSL